MKVKKQSNTALENLSYKEEFKLIYQNEGLSGFTRGYAGILIRDVPGFAIWFGAFEAFKELFRVDTDQPVGLTSR